ncbi:MAG: GAF domain-containing protein, partial [Dehalococcoidia bacterium]
LGSFASLPGSAFYNNDVQVVNDLRNHPLPRELDVAFGARSALAVPIRSGSDRILGAVSVSCYEAGYFDQDVVGKFLGLSRLVGDLMESTSPVESQSLHDMGRVGVPAT